MEIAVCVDHSRVTKEALREAREFADLVDGDLTLLHSVEEMVEEDDNGLIKEGQETAMERGQELLDELTDTIEEDATEVQTELIDDNEGGPVDNILDYVGKNDVDYIFIGHRGLDDRKEELFGSFAKDMISESDVPITVV